MCRARGDVPGAPGAVSSRNERTPEPGATKPGVPGTCAQAPAGRGGLRRLGRPVQHRSLSNDTGRKNRALPPHGHLPRSARRTPQQLLPVGLYFARLGGTELSGACAGTESHTPPARRTVIGPAPSELSIGIGLDAERAPRLCAQALEQGPRSRALPGRPRLGPRR